MKSAFKLNWLYNMESLTRGTHGSVDPTGQRNKTEPAALSKLARPWLVDGESAGGDVFTRRSTRRGASFALLARPYHRR